MSIRNGNMRRMLNKYLKLKFGFKWRFIKARVNPSWKHWFIGTAKHCIFFLKLLPGRLLNLQLLKIFISESWIKTRIECFWACWKLSIIIKDKSIVSLFYPDRLIIFDSFDLNCLLDVIFSFLGNALERLISIVKQDGVKMQFVRMKNDSLDCFKNLNFNF